jgi:hypothetical protein
MPVAATLTLVGAPSIPVVVDSNTVQIKGWALFAQPFFLRRGQIGMIMFW